MLELKNISKHLGDFSLKNINLFVDAEDYFVLLGISGAGKSVLLEMIAGLIEPDSGTIILNGEDITKAKIQKRDIGIVFQDFGVFPHLSVQKNIMYPLLNIGIHRAEAKKLALKYAEAMNIGHLMKRMPTTLSGGEKQRVALARTIAMKPKILLLDEPMASVDVELKEELRKLLRNINRMGITILHVTHDFEEAISLAEKVAIFNDGEVVQTGSSKEVFHNPKSRFLASFIGIKNFYQAKVIDENLSLAEGKVKIHHYRDYDATAGYLMFRSEDVIVSTSKIETSTLNNLHGRITDFYPSPHGVELIVDCGIKVAALITQESVEKMGLSIDLEVWVSFKSRAVRFIAFG